MAFVVKYYAVVLLPLLVMLVCASAEDIKLKRAKREWIIPPKKLEENVDYTKEPYIAKIRSSKEYKSQVTYSLKGPGADQPPLNLFTVDPITGFVKIHAKLDREVSPFYHLLGLAKYSNGSRAEKDIDLRIVVLDKNDCPPQFQFGLKGSVNESSTIGTVVMKVTATDADEFNTAHSQILYSIVETSNLKMMFSINSKTGEVTVNKNTLDRETQDTYTLIVKGTDMNGAPGGLSSTAEVVITVLDINDNFPTLEQESYIGKVEENTINIEVMRIKAIDLDLYFEYQLSIFTIVSGNEAGYFEIITNSKTNEGIIMIRKPLDYEQIKEIDLVVHVTNKAAYNFGSTSIKPEPEGTYPIKINVINQIEGPRFQPAVKGVTISEDITMVTINKVITNYAAIDSDTLLIATNVRYAKKSDIDNWIIVDETTGDIRLNKVPDRESHLLVNGTYYATITCTTKEVPSKTATGTIAIQVKDFNDHCPELTATAQTMCVGDNVIYVTAIDKDEYPNAGPFKFRVIQQSSKEKWSVEPFNETTVILRDHAKLWPNQYKVTLEIMDNQGKICDNVQVLDVVVCTCHESTKACVGQVVTAGFGVLGVLLFLLGLLLLLLLPLLLLFCLCGSPAAMGNFIVMPFEAKEHLIPYHTEGPGVDKEVPLLQLPVDVDHGCIKAVDINQVQGLGCLGGLGTGGAAAGGAAAGGGFISTSFVTTENMQQHQGFDQNDSRLDWGQTGGGTMMEWECYRGHGGSAYDGMALPDAFLEEYYSSKCNYATQQSHQRDSTQIYEYEGQESSAGSVGCCSLLENDNDLEFLNDLGPKFKTLAKICQGSTLVAESVEVDRSVHVPMPVPVSPVIPSTHSHTHTHTHTEAVRNRESISSTLHSSNVASGSSTVTEERLVHQGAKASATLPKVHFQDHVVAPAQTILIQQPALYYSATPMYVVDQQPQIVLVAGEAQQSVGQLGLGQGVVHGSHGMLVVEGQVGVRGGAGHAVPTAGQAVKKVSKVSKRGGQAVARTAGHTTAVSGQSGGSVYTSREVLVVENSSTSPGIGASADLAQVNLQMGQESSGLASEDIVQSVQEADQSELLSSSSLTVSVGSNEDSALMAAVKAPVSHTVVVQHEEFLVTKSNIETSTLA